MKAIKVRLASVFMTVALIGAMYLPQTAVGEIYEWYGRIAQNGSYLYANPFNWYNLSTGTESSTAPESPADTLFFGLNLIPTGNTVTYNATNPGECAQMYVISETFGFYMSGTYPARTYTTGTLTIGQTPIGESSAIPATFNLSGSSRDYNTFNVKDWLYVGSGGRGSLNVSQCTLTTQNVTVGDAVLSSDWNSNGDLAIDSTARMTTSGFLYVGSGSLTVEGRLTSAMTGIGIGAEGYWSPWATATVSGSLSGGSLTIGDNGGTGDMIVTGSVSQTGSIDLGTTASANGTLTTFGSITATKLNIAGTATAAGGTATVYVNSGSNINVSETVEIWSGGTYEQTGGSVTVGSLTNAGTLNFTGGTLTVDGGKFLPGSSFQIDGNANPTLILTNSAGMTHSGCLVVGGNASGTMCLTGGAAINTRQASIGSHTGSTGTVTVERALWAVLDDLYIGTSSDDPSSRGTGTLTINSGLVSADNLILGDNGMVDVTHSGKMLIGEGSGVFNTGTVWIGHNGTLSGTGTIHGLVVNAGGTVSPGRSPGTLHLDRFTQESDGTLVMEIAGLTAGTEYDVLEVAGDIQLGGTLSLAFLNGFAPQIGDTFTLFQCGGQISGGFNSVIMSGLAQELQYSLNVYTNSLQMTVVPEPAMLSLLLLGGLSFLRRRK